MPAPIPIEIRQQAVAAYERGEGSYEEVAQRFGVSARALMRWVARLREVGTVEPRARGGGWFSPIERDLLEAVLVEKRDSTADEITKAYNARVAKDRRVHRSSVLRALHRFSYVFKKNGGVRRSSSGQM